MKKILIFSLSYLPNFTSGAEEAIREITDRTDPTEYEFHMVTNQYNSTLPKTETIGNVLIHRIGISKPNPTFTDLSKFPLDLNKPLFQFLAAYKALRLHKQHRFDGIWAMMAHSTGVPAALFKLFKPNVPYVLTLQEGDPPEHIEKTMKPLWPLFTRAFTKADRIQAISSFLADWARQRDYTGTIEIIHNGANPRDLIDEFDPTPIEKIKQELNKQPNDIFLTNTARLEHQKAADITIQALKQLPDNIKLMLVGDGSKRQELEALAAKLDISNRVLFTGKVDRSVVTDYRRAADIFVGPSRSEGLGNAFLSAMACGLPVIATQVGGIADFLFDKKHNPDKQPTGWVVDPDNPEQIAQAVTDIVQHPEKVSEIKTNARKLIEQKYTWDAIARDMRTKIFEVIF